MLIVLSRLILRERRNCLFQMKKLLALILCVMMFASLSVNAFAAPWQPATTAANWRDAIAARTEYINDLYGEWVADNAMYETAVVARNTLSALSTTIMNTIAAAGPAGYVTAADRTNSLAALQRWFAAEMLTRAPGPNTHVAGTSVGNPIDDLNTFVAAVNGAFNELASAQNIGEIQNAVLDAMIANVKTVYNTLYNQLSAAGTDYNNWMNGAGVWVNFGNYLGSGLTDFAIPAPGVVLAPAGTDPLAATDGLPPIYVTP